jgi:hypothetical protein
MINIEWATDVVQRAVLLSDLRVRVVMAKEMKARW